MEVLVLASELEYLSCKISVCIIDSGFPILQTKSCIELDLHLYVQLYIVEI